MSDLIKILGIPYDGSSSFMRGPAMGPDKIRTALHGGSANYWTELGLDLEPWLKSADLGNLQFDEEKIETIIPTIEQAITHQLDLGYRLLSLGGDHFISYPIIKAYAKKYPELHILQIDAHGDLYDHFEGNPYSHACPFARIMENGLAKSLTQVGIRTLNQHQKEQAKLFGVKIIEMKDYQLDFVNQLKGPLYISLDLDGFDPSVAPGVSHHEPGGFSARQVLEIIHSIKVPVVGADVVELNPRRDPIEMTAMLAAKMLKELFGLMQG